jgi:hypothetical protein
LCSSRARAATTTVVMISTPLSALDLTDSRSAVAELRLQRVREAVHDGTYRPPAELVAEALLTSSLIGLPPDPRVVAWAC